jgi:transmembrane sensor
MNMSTRPESPDGLADAASEVSHDVMEAAAEWYALLVSGEAAVQDQRRWRSWLAVSAEHRQAWSYVELVSNRVLAPLQHSADPRLTSDTLWAANTRLSRRRRALKRIAAFAGAGVLGYAAWQRDPVRRVVLSMAADHSTAIGEIREVALADGSRVWLNTASAFNQDYQPGLRRLHMLAGEILVTTGSDAARPFVVDTPHGRMRALGTRFTVRIEHDKTLLAVYEGKVAVHTAASDTTLVLVAGQQTLFDRESINRPGAADPTRQAWSRGQLIAWDLPLKDVVQELARYHQGHLSVAPEIAERRVFGTYPLRDVPATLAMLADATQARLYHPLPWWTTIKPER